LEEITKKKWSKETFGLVVCSDGISEHVSNFDIGQYVMMFDKEIFEQNLKAEESKAIDAIIRKSVMQWNLVI
jgi:serine/threonine protein phosphatase PrpC